LAPHFDSLNGVIESRVDAGSTALLGC
jgi:hypothetical protein